MQHTNPFSNVGYDIQDLKRQIEHKADQHEIHALNSKLDRLEHSLREACAETDGLRLRCKRLEEVVRELNPGACL